MAFPCPQMSPNDFAIKIATIYICFGIYSLSMILYYKESYLVLYRITTSAIYFSTFPLPWITLVLNYIYYHLKIFGTQFPLVASSRTSTPKHSTNGNYNHNKRMLFLRTLAENIESWFFFYVDSQLLCLQKCITIDKQKMCQNYKKQKGIYTCFIKM